MAYSIDVAPRAKEALLALPPKAQRQVIEHIEAEAANPVPETGKIKKLRRTEVEGFRVIFLELHDLQKIMLLKIADPTEIHHRFWETPATSTQATVSPEVSSNNEAVQHEPASENREGASFETDETTQEAQPEPTPPAQPTEPPSAGDEKEPPRIVMPGDEESYENEDAVGRNRPDPFNS